MQLVRNNIKRFVGYGLLMALVAILQASWVLLYYRGWPIPRFQSEMDTLALFYLPVVLTCTLVGVLAYAYTNKQTERWYRLCVGFAVGISVAIGVQYIAMCICLNLWGS